MEKSESQKIIEKIKEEKIVPESKLSLNWKSYLFWSLWVLMLGLGALFFSLIIFNFMDFHPLFLKYLKIGKLIRLLVLTAPLFWILLALGALFSGLLAFRKTKHGYRYSLIFVTSLTILIVSFLGVTFHFSRVNDHFREGFFPREPGMMERMAFPIEGRWENPEEGFLGGRINRMGEDCDCFEMEDLRGEKWEVHYSPETKIFDEIELEGNCPIGMIGEKRGERKFEAEVIGPFPERGMHEGRAMRRMQLEDDFEE